MARNIIVCPLPGPSPDEADFEVCEHKGIGHPDSLMDGLCEASSRELSKNYLLHFGKVMHHNVDKGLLVGGRSRPRFGGGELLKKIKIIVCGRATPLSDGLRVEEIIEQAVQNYLKKHIRCNPSDFEIFSELHDGSPNLQQVFAGTKKVPAANDTSFGCGYAPFSRLEKAVLGLSQTLRSDRFREKFPAAGDDLKIMGHRIREKFFFTIALALIDRHVENSAHYFEIKHSIARELTPTLGFPALIRINTLDKEKPQVEEDLYLTVTGLSAEMGDDGQVGRGNRVNGLITPYRPMSLEAAAGKNPTHHVGKIYNVLAHLMAQDMKKEIKDLLEIHVTLLSAIGESIDGPAAAFIQARTKKDTLEVSVIEEIADRWLEKVAGIGQRILREEIPLF